MANQPRTTAAGTRDVDGDAAPLTAEEEKEIRESDPADTAVPAKKTEFTGKRIRGIPAVITNSGDRGTTIEITRENFAAKGLDQDTVVFDIRNDRYTLVVGDESGQISEKAADFLTKNYPTSFEYMDNS
jgi:hypothetical protein